MFKSYPILWFIYITQKKHFTINIYINTWHFVVISHIYLLSLGIIFVNFLPEDVVVHKELNRRNLLSVFHFEFN